MSQSYVEELVILTIVGSILVATKIIACCLSLGLHQKHKAISLRRDSLSIARKDNSQLPVIASEARRENQK